MLEAPPSSNSIDGNNNNQSYERVGTGISPIPETLRDEMRVAGQELRQMIHRIREQVQQTGNEQRELLAQVQTMRQEWQTIPEALIDPQNAANNNNNSRPTSKAYLDKIPRVVLNENSSLLYQARLHIPGLPEMEGIIGDFESKIKAQVQTGNLAVAHPRTGLGGLSADTKAMFSKERNSNGDNDKNNSNTGNQKANTFLCFERGDGVTFVQKAMMAQKEGATACIIANHVAEPWPYVMKDSKREATKNGGLHIPTVMIKKSDAEQIWKLGNGSGSSCKKTKHSSALCTARLEISQPVRDCVVCTESFTSGSTVMRLPPCGHLFHEACVLQWLNKHNTCPFCRRELPTDDEEYEQERRRQQRTHAGSSGNTNSSGYTDFYG